ncbi:hypothetical protein M407DRAFT_18171 [Tulasnella calospora MUT 4182]|uniref:Protein kinase domain-containing protein n=1 Tax=Tulasnella calospora MUT 4182 TaxID=1051891 RepID=A0A0C3QW30_9AGAM|nr:hypothetical protein M407DRAFT_18171 [Tulasnella calospora MUT 4182]
MSESMNQKEQSSRSTSAQEAAIAEVEDYMKRLRIHPRKVLESLSHLRIDGARIKPIEGQPPKAGGKAEVEAAILASGKESGSSESDEEEYVAVKKLRFDDTDDDRTLAPLAHEVNLLNNLSHESVVEILGFVENVEQGVAWMVFAWQGNGNLREFIRSAKWELPERVSLIDDVARGLSYLHGRDPPICHGDLKSNRAMITDFGSARAVDSVAETALKGVPAAKATPTPHSAAMEAQEAESVTAEIAPSGDFITMTGPAWTVRWAAPELLHGDLPGLASDIWALGWISWEAVTGNFPFEKENNIIVIVRITKGDLPPVETDDQFHQIKALCSLMRECWKLDTSERPTAVKCRQAISYMNQIVPSSREVGNLSEPRSSGLLYALGQIQLEDSMYTKAQEYFQRSLKVAESVGDERATAKVVKAIGDVYRMRDEYSKAEESYIQARDIYSQIGHQLGFAQSVDSLGDVYLLRNEYSKAEESFIQARDIYSQTGHQRGFAQSLRSLGEVYQTLDEYSKAEESYMEARNIYSQIGDQLGFAQSVFSLGDVYRLRDEDSKAEELYIQARDIYSQLGNRVEFAKTLDRLGAVYLVREEYSKAEESLIQARDIYSQVGEPLGFAQSVHGLGDVYHMREEYTKAEESYIQARDIYSRIGNQLGLAQSLDRMGLVHVAREEYARAEESYSEAQQIYDRIGDMRLSANILWYRGVLHCAQDQYREAVRLVVEGSTIYGRLGLEEVVKECDELLERIHTLPHLPPPMPIQTSPMTLNTTQLSSWSDKQLVDEHRRLSQVILSSGRESTSPETVPGTFDQLPPLIAMLILKKAREDREFIEAELLLRDVALPGKQ